MIYPITLVLVPFDLSALNNLTLPERSKPPGVLESGVLERGEWRVESTEQCGVLYGQRSSK